MSRNRILLLMIFMVLVQVVTAQDYMIQGTTPNLHLSHKVAAKETWYSISRTYNVSPKDLAAYNKVTIGKSLEIGQDIKVPLVSGNFSQNDVKSSGETFVPLYHIVQEKEWLYRISVNHNKVPVEKLEKWNSLSKDGAKPGMKLIVGYLKVKDGNVAVPKPTAEEKETVVKKENNSNREPAKTVDEDKRPEPDNQVRQVSVSGAGGYFRNQYSEDGKASSGVSGIFKSTSGWNDGKYYALMNNVNIGTIIKINYPSTNKTIYAKVLGELPDMKESSGLALRISDAAASELGVATSKFSVDVKY